MAEPALRLLVAANVPPDPNSGAAGTVWHTNIALRRLGHEVDELWADDLPVRRINHGNLHSLLEQPRSYRLAIRDKVRRARYDVVQVSQPQAYQAARALRDDRFPGVVVNRSHGVEPRFDAAVAEWQQRLGVAGSRSALASSFLRRLLARQWRGIARDCDGVLVGCTMDRDFLIERLGIEPQRVAVAAHGVAPQFLERGLPAPSPERWRKILHVGQLAFFKGPDLLVRIVDEVLSQDPEAEFTWVCAAADHDRARAMLSERVRGRVRLLGWMSSEQLVDEYDRHGIFLFPSLFEGFGKAPVEAMSRSMCVVASDEGGMRDCIEDGEDGVLRAVGDVPGFASATLSLLQAPIEAERIGDAAVLKSRTLTWEDCARRAVDFYRLLQRAGRKTGTGPTE